MSGGSRPGSGSRPLAQPSGLSLVQLWPQSKEQLLLGPWTAIAEEGDANGGTLVLCHLRG